MPLRGKPEGHAAGTSFIDASCELSGKLHFRESVQIDGHVEGEIQAEKLVTIGAPGTVRADIRCESIVIRGNVEGDIAAKRNITFHKGAHVNGQMRASGIVIEEGASFKGCIEIGDDGRPAPALAQAATPTAAKS